jgi:putative SOS response-associated peptidase YedK
MFVCAGIWERCDNLDEPVETVSVLTMPANTLVMPMDPRMPVIVGEEHFDAWLDPNEKDPAKLLTLFKPFPDEQMECWPVSTRVNDPANDDQELLTPISNPL